MTKEASNGTYGYLSVQSLKAEGSANEEDTDHHFFFFYSRNSEVRVDRSGNPQSWFKYVLFVVESFCSPALRHTFAPVLACPSSHDDGEQSSGTILLPLC